MRLFALMAGCLLSLTAFAAPAQFIVTWSAPTQFVDGTTITTPILYRVYAGPSGKEVPLATPVTAPPFIVLPLPPAGTTECVQVTAEVNGVESARSPEICKGIPFPVPNPPSKVAADVKV